MKILITSSSTGGHFYPAIKIIKTLYPELEKTIFILQKGTKFKDVIKDEFKQKGKILFEEIPASKFIRKNPFSLLKIIFSFIICFAKILKILVKHSPNLVLSFGGYTSFPVIITAKFFNPFIPIILHEQNCNFSLTNKFLKFLATKICLGFDIKKGKKYVFTGNPLREGFYRFLKKEDILKEFGLKDTFTLLIFGGSQGARNINDAFVRILKTYKERFKEIQIIHITGFDDYERIKQEYKNFDFNYYVLPFTKEMEKFYLVADLAICRAGAMTISELIHFKKPAILIPLPTAAEFHQNWNADFLKKYGCAKVVYQSGNWWERLNNELFYILDNTSVISEMSKNYAKIPQPTISVEKVVKNIYKQKYG